MTSDVGDPRPGNRYPTSSWQRVAPTVHHRPLLVRAIVIIAGQPPGQGLEQGQ